MTEDSPSTVGNEDTPVPSTSADCSASLVQCAVVLHMAVL